MRRRTFLTGLSAAIISGCSSTGTSPTGAMAPTGAAAPPTPAEPEPSPTGEPAAGPQAPKLIQRVPGAAGVALTFHLDGDVGLATELFDVLRDLDAPMTAMVVGQWLEANPSFATRLVDEGHDIGNHTYSHGDMPTMDADQIRSEIDQCAAVLETQLGTRGRWFRPSAVDVPSELMTRVAAEAGYEATVGFSVDPVDYRASGPDSIVAAVVDVAQPGDIVSLHFGYPASNQAIPAIVGGLRARDLEPVTLATLLD